MVEVVVAPSHLAGSCVLYGKIEDGSVPPMLWLVLDRKHPTKGGNIAVSVDDVDTIHMLPAEVEPFRKILGPCPESTEVEVALRAFGEKCS